jgi:hypothetical protein
MSFSINKYEEFQRIPKNVEDDKNKKDNKKSI